METGGADASRGPRAAQRPAPGAPWTGAEAPGSGAAPSPRPSYDSDLHRGSIRLDLSSPPPTARRRDGRGLRRGQQSVGAAEHPRVARGQTDLGPGPPSRAGAATHRARHSGSVVRVPEGHVPSRLLGVSRWAWGGSVDLNLIERWQCGTGKGWPGASRASRGWPAAGASTEILASDVRTAGCHRPKLRPPSNLLGTCSAVTQSYTPVRERCTARTGHAESKQLLTGRGSERAHP